MVWIHGNNPVGIDKNVGRVWCELLYAINERQVFCGAPPFGWQTIGPFPAVTALDGFDILTLEHTLIAEARSAIESMSELDYFYPPFPSTTPYTFATLYAAAMGGGSGWQIPATTGEDFTQTIVIEELFKCTEKMNRRMSLFYVDDLQGWYSFAADSFATTDAAWADCRTQPYTYGWGLPFCQAYSNAHYFPIPDEYPDCSIVDCFVRFDLTALAGVTIDQAALTFWIGSVGPAVVSEQPVRILSSTAGEWAAPTRNPAGAVLGSHTMLESEEETYVIVVWNGASLSPGSLNYLRLDVAEAGNALPSDPNTDIATMRAILADTTLPLLQTVLRVYYAKTIWTYG